MMEKTNIEICRDKLMELGTAMFAFLTGKELHPEQIKMINEATDKQILLALELVAVNNLKGQEYTNYCQNKRKLSRSRTIRKD